MFSGETPRSEAPEAEKDPEKVVSDAVSEIKNKDAADPVISSKWVEKAKTTFEASGKITGISLALLFGLCAKLLYGVYNFAKRAVEKKGQIGFGEGFKIGQEAPLIERKKEKK